ncbi:MAG: DUF882 domain-containing protein [Kofleriaceae bacterium]
MAGWLASASPVPVPAAEAAVAIAEESQPVEVLLYDENAREEATVWIHRDGTADEENTAEITRLFRCRRTHKDKPIAKGTLAMLADIATRYPGKRIEYVSGYRASREESRTSPHRAARAIDFRIRGVSLIEIRDYLWTTYREVGIGWYPKEQYIHMDHRPGEKDIAWTFVNGDNVYHPSWSDRARSKVRLDRTPGV